MSDEAAPDCRVLIGKELERWEMTNVDLYLARGVWLRRTAILRAALEIVDEQHYSDHNEATARGAPIQCHCQQYWPCPRAAVALEKLWSAIK